MFPVAKFLRAVGAALLLTALVAPASVRAQAGISVTGGIGLPVGDLGNSASTGFNLGGRLETNKGPTGWGFRGDVSWDQFSGKGSIDELSYLGLAGNLVHRSSNSSFYQFGGLGVYRSMVDPNLGSESSDTNLGAQLGVGMNLSRDGRIFGEAGLTSAFTTGRSSVWFPIRVGFRF